MMKKWLSLCLCALLLLSLTACGKTSPDKNGGGPACYPLPPDENYVQGMAKLEAGDLTEAYTLLKSSTDPRAAEELEKFVFVPTTYRTETSRGYDVTTNCTYDSLGNLILQVSTGREHADDTEDTTRMECTFDGYLQTSVSHWENGALAFRNVYTYNEQGKVLTFRYHDEDDEVGSSSDCTYDERGNLIQEHAYTPGGGQTLTTYTYDTADRVLIKKTTHDDGARWTTEHYTYLEDSSYVCTEQSHPATDVHFCYYYNKDGNLLKAESVAEDGTRRTEKECRYNEQGKAVYEYARESASGAESVHTYVYDERGNLLERQWTEDGQVIITEKNTYDASGNHLTYDYTHTAGWIKHTYTYDANGNRLTYQGTSDEGWYNAVYTYDEAGNLLTEEWEQNTNNGRIQYTYDQWGNATRVVCHQSATNGNEYNATATAQWELHYYPEGVSYDIERAISDALYVKHDGFLY